MSDNLIGATTAIFIVSLSIAVNEPVDVAWSTRDGTAKAGTDYKAANGVVSFLPGETRKQIEVTVYGQNVSPTGDKNFFINLMPPTNAVLGTTLIEAVIKVEDESGVPVTSVIVAQGKRGLKGDPGLSAYEQAVLMGYDGTLEDWMQEQADAAAAAQRAGDYAANAAAAATKAENAATAASFLGNIFPTPEAGVDPVTGVGNGAYYNVRSPDDDSYLVEYQNIGGVPTPSGKSYPSSAYVQKLSESVADLTNYVPVKFESAKEYAVGERVVLENTDIVINTVAGNTNNPNVDMTGWKNEWADQRDKNSLSVDILDYIPKSQWSAIFNKTSAYDCSDALEQAIGSGLEVKVSRSGLYVFKTAKEYATDIKITAEAPDAWFDFSQVPAAQVGLKNSGSATLLVSAFASLITEGDRSITLPDVSTLQAGDTLCFYNPTDFSFSGYREYYRDGEFLKIQQIVGNVVYFTNPIKSSYASSSIDIYKLNLKNVVLRDIKVRYYTPFANGVGGIGALRFDFCDFKSYNFYAEAQSSQVLALSRCPNPKLYNTNGFNLGAPTFGSGGLEYFVLFGNCQDWRMFGGDIYSQRHAVAQGGGAAICSIPVSGKAYDLTTRNYFSTSVGSFDAHGNVRECKLVNCTIYNSAKFAGSGIIYENCKIYGSQTGVIVLTTEFKGGRHGLINCELISYASPRTASRSFVDFGSNTEVITDKTVLDTEIFALNTKVKLRNADPLDQFCRIVNRGGSKKININFDNIEFDSNVKINSVVRISSIVASPTAVADSDYIIIDNILGKNAPIPIVHENSAYQQFPHRLPVVRGVKRATTTASATVPVTGVAYGYTLPKRPFLELNITGADGAALSTLGGQSLFMPVISAPGLTTFNASINAAAAFTAGAEFDLQYTASIREC